MNDITENVEESADSQTLGKILLDARLSCQISQADMATKLCLGESVVEDIETDRLDGTINPVFSKGYVKNYAKVVGVDLQLVLQLFELQYQPDNAPDKMQSFSQRNKAQTHNSYLNSVTILIVLGLIAMLIAWWWQQRNESADTTLNTAESSVAQASVNLKSQPLDEIVPSLTPVLQAKDSTDTLATVEDNINPRPQLIVNHRLEFTFSKDCWVKVTDASNEVLAIGIKKAGRFMQLDGVAPFEVTLGAPEAVSVKYQDKPLDFTAFITGNKARFSVPLEE